MSKFIDVQWFDCGTLGQIGFVLVLDEHMGFKVYAGTPNQLIPRDEQIDIDDIRRNGGKLPFLWAFAIWGDRMFAEWDSLHFAKTTMPPLKYDGEEITGLGHLGKGLKRLG